MEQIIFPKSLTPRQAVHEVIKNNKSQRYNPQRFINMMDAMDDKQMLSKMEGLIVSSEDKVFGVLLNQIYEKKYILTIEDFIVLFGEDWGVCPKAIQTAKKQVILFDECAGGQRFEIKKG